MPESVTVSADDVALASAVLDIADRVFGVVLSASIPRFADGVEASRRLAVVAAGAGMPEDPVAGPDQAAISHHELMCSYERAGFEHGEAFMITLAHIQAFAQGHALRGGSG